MYVVQKLIKEKRIAYKCIAKYVFVEQLSVIQMATD